MKNFIVVFDLFFLYLFFTKIFIAKDLTIERTTNPAAKPADAEKVPFGAVFTDHMLEIDWTAENGWGNPQIKPFQPLQLVSLFGMYIVNSIILPIKHFFLNSMNIFHIKPRIKASR